MGRTHERCRHCGFGIPADAPLCPGCCRPAIDDWKRRARAVASVERKARRIDPPLRGEGYRSLLSRATAARAGLAASTAAAVVTAGAYAAAVLAEDPVVSVGGADLELAAWTRGSTAVLLGLLAVTGAAFIAWAVRAYRNLPALGIEERRYWTIWLVIGWVIPGANLLVPKLVVDDLWRASSPNARIGGGGDWQRRPVASLVNQWWCSFLLSPAVVLLAVVAARGGIDETGQRLVIGSLCTAAAIAVVIAAIAARRLVAVVTVAQARRADIIVDLREQQESARAHVAAMAHLQH
jgi:hypothetical protein